MPVETTKKCFYVVLLMSSKSTLTCRFDWEPVSEPDQAAFINHVLRNRQQNCETMHFNWSSGTWWTGHSFSEFPGLIFKKKKITFVVQWIKIRLRRGEDRRKHWWAMQFRSWVWDSSIWVFVTMFTLLSPVSSRAFSSF